MDTDFGFGGPRHPGQGAFRAQTFTPGSQSMGRKGATKQDPPIERDLTVTLDEVLKGCVKRMKITRRVVNPDGTSCKEDKVLTINVRPGWKSGTKITFQKEGDQHPGRIPADIVFIIKDKPDPRFKRDGADLRYTAKITLREALCGCTINVPTISNSRVQLRINDIIRPTTTRRISGQGLPYPKDPSKRGDIVVHFDIQFPDTLSAEAKQILGDVLP